MHEWMFDSEDGADVRFMCAQCGGGIGFNRPGVGEPAAVPIDGGAWAPPEGADQWYGRPCQ